MNLLKETIEKLKGCDKTPEDVLWVGNQHGYSTWQDFEKVANIEYDNGYGGNEIAMDLVVVGNDWWLSRGEYDGSEWWDFNRMPDKPAQQRKLKSVENQNYDDEVTFK